MAEYRTRLRAIIPIDNEVFDFDLDTDEDDDEPLPELTDEQWKDMEKQASIVVSAIRDAQEKHYGAICSSPAASSPAINTRLKRKMQLMNQTPHKQSPLHDITNRIITYSNQSSNLNNSSIQNLINLAQCKFDMSPDIKGVDPIDFQLGLVNPMCLNLDGLDSSPKKTLCSSYFYPPAKDLPLLTDETWEGLGITSPLMKQMHRDSLTLNSKVKKSNYENSVARPGNKMKHLTQCTNGSNALPSPCRSVPNIILPAKELLGSEGKKAKLDNSSVTSEKPSRKSILNVSFTINKNDSILLRLGTPELMQESLKVCVKDVSDLQFSDGKTTQKPLSSEDIIHKTPVIELVPSEKPALNESFTIDSLIDSKEKPVIELATSQSLTHVQGGCGLNESVTIKEPAIKTPVMNESFTLEEKNPAMKESFTLERKKPAMNESFTVEGKSPTLNEYLTIEKPALNESFTVEKKPSLNRSFTVEKKPSLNESFTIDSLIDSKEKPVIKLATSQSLTHVQGGCGLNESVTIKAPTIKTPAMNESFTVEGKSPTLNKYLTIEKPTLNVSLTIDKPTLNESLTIEKPTLNESPTIEKPTLNESFTVEEKKPSLNRSFPVEEKKPTLNESFTVEEKKQSLNRSFPVEEKKPSLKRSFTVEKKPSGLNKPSSLNQSLLDKSITKKTGSVLKRPAGKITSLASSKKRPLESPVKSCPPSKPGTASKLNTNRIKPVLKESIVPNSSTSKYNMRTPNITFNKSISLQKDERGMVKFLGESSNPVAKKPKQTLPLPRNKMLKKSTKVSPRKTLPAKAENKNKSLDLGPKRKCLISTPPLSRIATKKLPEQSAMKDPVNSKLMFPRKVPTAMKLDHSKLASSIPPPQRGPMKAVHDDQHNVSKASERIPVFNSSIKFNSKLIPPSTIPHW